MSETSFVHRRTFEFDIQAAGVIYETFYHVIRGEAKLILCCLADDIVIKIEGISSHGSSIDLDQWARFYDSIMGNKFDAIYTADMAL